MLCLRLGQKTKSRDSQVSATACQNHNPKKGVQLLTHHLSQGITLSFALRCVGELEVPDIVGSGISVFVHHLHIMIRSQCTNATSIPSVDSISR